MNDHYNYNELMNFYSKTPSKFLQPIGNARNFKERPAYIFKNFHFQNVLTDAYKSEKFKYED